MKIYDHNTKRLQELDIETDVSMYLCGPTVYDHVHIGNLRPLVVQNLLADVLRKAGHNVKLVSNITDIDDKIIDKAKAENSAIEDVSARYMMSYFDVVGKYVDQSKIQFTTVLQNFHYINNYVDRLNDIRAVYPGIDEDLWFGVNTSDALFAPTKQLTGSKDKYKMRPEDFAVWKTFEDPILSTSVGRPGWHVECSALIEKEFGKQVDIHGGGIDLKFPHHNNENALHKCLHNEDIARYWFHTGHVTVDGEKMSKSLGNVLLVKDLDYNSLVVKLVLFSSLYRNPLDLKPQAFTMMNKKLKRWLQKTMARVRIDTWPNEREYTGRHANENISEFVEILQVDLNTPKAIATLDKWANNYDKRMLPALELLLGKNIVRLASYEYQRLLVMAVTQNIKFEMLYSIDDGGFHQNHFVAMNDADLAMFRLQS